VSVSIDGRRYSASLRQPSRSPWALAVSASLLTFVVDCRDPRRLADFWATVLDEDIVHVLDGPDD
jgi:hypothetical protein